ncbi:MAG TPA: biotin/lipoyl-binding protein [Blastocatellia bacterium]|nr:biotin/lipoyl-binding protein [Blastocatellia bacterium]
MVKNKGLPLVLILICLALALAAACRHATPTEQGSSVGIAVSAPVTGVVRRVLVSDGASVDQGAALLEIEAQPTAALASRRTDEAKEQRRAALGAAQADIKVAKEEAGRAAEKVKRIEPLVRQGYASRADLNAARASYQDAQARLQRAYDKLQSAQMNTNGNSASPATAAPTEQAVLVRAPVAGTVRAIEVQTGQHVTAGQQLATVVSKS